MMTDHLTAAQRETGRLFLEGQGWGYGGSVDVAPIDPWNVPGRYGWVGGTGTAAHIVAGHRHGRDPAHPGRRGRPDHHPSDAGLLAVRRRPARARGDVVGFTGDLPQYPALRTRRSPSTGAGRARRQRRLQVRAHPAVRRAWSGCRSATPTAASRCSAFPCNQFGGQEPGTAEEIAEFCSATYGVDLPDDREGRRQRRRTGTRSTSELTGPPDAEGEAGDVQWNFEKFLVAPRRRGRGPFRPQTEPESDEVVEAIEETLPS